MMETSRVTQFLKKNNHDNDLQLLLPKTHFKPIEFKLLKQQFASLCGDTSDARGRLCLNYQQSRELFFPSHLQRRNSNSTPNSNNSSDNSTFVFSPEDEFILGVVFRAVNTENDGLLSFSELATAMSTAVHGNFYEKAKFSFRLYDLENEGKITIRNMQTYISILSKLSILRLEYSSRRKKTRGEMELDHLNDMKRRHRDMSVVTDDWLFEEEDDVKTISPVEKRKEELSAENVGETEHPQTHRVKQMPPDDNRNEGRDNKTEEQQQKEPEIFKKHERVQQSDDLEPPSPFPKAILTRKHTIARRGLMLPPQHRRLVGMSHANSAVKRDSASSTPMPNDKEEDDQNRNERVNNESEDKERSSLNIDTNQINSPARVPEEQDHPVKLDMSGRSSFSPLDYSPTPHPLGKEFITKFFNNQQLQRDETARKQVVSPQQLQTDDEEERTEYVFTGTTEHYSPPCNNASSPSTPSSESSSELRPPSADDISRLLLTLFSNKTELTFQDYLLVASEEKYLVEGLGLFEYIFHPMYNPIQEFLNSKRPYEKSGLLKYKNKVYHVEIRGGIMYRYDEKKRFCKKMINIEKLDKVRYEKRTVFSVKKGRKWSRYESTSPDESIQHWVFCLMLFMVSRKDNRFDSFAPVRRHSAVQHLVDGKETFAAIAHAMLNAKEQIFIAGWSVSPYLYMRRDRDIKNPSQYRLDNILSRMASNGVQVYIIMWHETTIAGMNLSASKIQKILTSLHPNIRCIMHPRGAPYQWTHHQKCVIVDQVIAFCGGLDLAWGRYDTPSHQISDNCHYMMTWPGNDYYNGSVSGFVKINLKLDSFRDGFDRDKFPRMPWHDVHCVAIGKLVKDLSSNFISRWNHHNGMAVSSSVPISVSDDEFINYSSVLELMAFDPEKASKAHLYLPSNITHLHHVRGQVLRSISTWSGSMRTEQSIHMAYVETIKRSQYYIYIENQYFCSHTPRSMEIENLVAQAITERIGRAILSKEVFRVYILVPIHPDGDPFDSSIQQVIKWQRRTIEGVYETLRVNFPQSNIDDYIVFLSLCNYGFIQHVPHFNQVYIHSKLLLVDDKTVIIGSANINDRSMVGGHDSELALIIEDADSSQTMMNNKLRRVGKFGKSLRKRLWREHLGLDVHHHINHEEHNTNEQTTMGTHHHHNRANSPNNHFEVVSTSNTSLAHKFHQQKQNIMNQPISLAIKDPISDHTFNNVWKRRAKDNTHIYESVFQHYPSKRHSTMNEWKKSVDAYYEQAGVMDYNQRLELYHRAKKQLSQIKGLVVEHPMDWLSREQHKKDIKLQVLDDNIFF